MPMRKTGRDDIDRTEDRPFTKDPSRVVAISDGVFAVALTLLILDVKPPTVGQTLLASAIIATVPRLGIFALSFAIVAWYWVSHHFSFGYVRIIDRGLLWLNMLFLFTIVVLPFSAGCWLITRSRRRQSRSMARMSRRVPQRWRSRGGTPWAND